MRISSGMIHDAGVSAINRQTSDLFHNQQQLATGRRVLSPADDPVASASALVVNQALDMNGMYGKANGRSMELLGYAEGQLQSASDLMLSVRTLAVQAGNNTALNDNDRQAIAQQLRASFDQLMGIANARDANGQFIFSGYMGDTQPFSGTVDSGVRYFGDDGQRMLQVSPSQQVAVSQSGNNVFNRVPSGNGQLTTAYGPNNGGSGIVINSSVTAENNWTSVNNSGNLEVRFWVDPSVTPNPTYYDLVDASTNPPVSLFTGTQSIASGSGNTYTHSYVPGRPIDFNNLAVPYNDFGATVTISGSPVNGDSFSVKRSTSQSVFDTLRNLIGALERPTNIGANNKARLDGDIASALNNLDQANQNFLTERTRIGASMNQLQALNSLNGSVDLQYQQNLSNLQDVDYAKTISDMTRLQTQLQAAQQSFVKVSNLSLFNYIN